MTAVATQMLRRHERWRSRLEQREEVSTVAMRTWVRRSGALVFHVDFYYNGR